MKQFETNQNEHAPSRVIAVFIINDSYVRKREITMADCRAWWPSFSGSCPLSLIEEAAQHFQNLQPSETLSVVAGLVPGIHVFLV